MTGYAGLAALAAAMGMFGLRLRRPLPDWLVWEAMAALGVLLALGTKTPLGHLFVHLPLFGGQRLQSRNLAIVDLALSVLLAYWAEEVIRRQWALGWARPDRFQLLSVLPVAAAAVFGVVDLISPAGMAGFLGASIDQASNAAGDRPLIALSVALSLALAAAILWLPLASSARRGVVLAAFVVVDLVSFNLTSLWPIATGLAPPTRSGVAAAVPTSAATPQTIRVSDFPRVLGSLRHLQPRAPWVSSPRAVAAPRCECQIRPIHRPGLQLDRRRPLCDVDRDAPAEWQGFRDAVPERSPRRGAQPARNHGARDAPVLPRGTGGSFAHSGGRDPRTARQWLPDGRATHDHPVVLRPDASGHEGLGAGRTRPGSAPRRNCGLGYSTAPVRSSGNRAPGSLSAPDQSSSALHARRQPSVWSWRRGEMSSTWERLPSEPRRASTQQAANWPTPSRWAGPSLATSASTRIS